MTPAGAAVAKSTKNAITPKIRNTSPRLSVKLPAKAPPEADKKRGEFHL